MNVDADNGRNQNEDALNPNLIVDSENNQMDSQHIDMRLKILQSTHSSNFTVP